MATQGVEHYRAVRREIEEGILPLATSIDGRRFTFQTSLHGLALHLGGYVTIEADGARAFGQLLALRQASREAGELEVSAGDGDTAMRAGMTIRLGTGEGAILEGGGVPFHDALVRPATASEVRDWADRAAETIAPLTIGELALSPGVPCRLDARGFDRHTFLCGQSGSGKTYSLGVMLEHLLMETSLRIVVLDPNSDFVRLDDVRQSADRELAARYGAAADGVTVHSAGARTGTRLRLRLTDLAPEAQAALLRIDPIADREEYAELVQALATGGHTTAEALEASGGPGAQRLALRVRNLGLESYGVWARDAAGTVLEAVRDSSSRCVVVDLGSLGTREEQALVSTAVLGELWRHREEREPVLIVIDEAHNVCPAEPPDGLTALSTELAVRIAAEGRKFGLYLLVSTQRPQKVHENVISQCDNLVLMRLNSVADARFAQSIFSFVPAGLIEQAVTFSLGEALVSGKISASPALLRFGARVSEEGGSDVPSDWAG